MNEEELVLKIETGSVGDNIEVTRFRYGFNITIEEPWAGDTETGFGYASSIRLTDQQMNKLYMWLRDIFISEERQRG